MKTAFQNQDVAKYAAQGILLPMEDYITEENTPNIWRMFREQPTIKAISTSPDGHIYSLPSYGGNKSSFQKDNHKICGCLFLCVTKFSTTNILT
ncbi:MAG: hypothetical protein E7401_04805 [Ruminococcaceae bacterium]|nr:hypothetical protein [Oscillospiraceae bacterium]